MSSVLKGNSIFFFVISGEHEFPAELNMSRISSDSEKSHQTRRAFTWVNTLRLSGFICCFPDNSQRKHFVAWRGRRLLIDWQTVLMRIKVRVDGNTCMSLRLHVWVEQLQSNQTPLKHLLRLFLNMSASVLKLCEAAGLCIIVTENPPPCPVRQFEPYVFIMKKAPLDRRQPSQSTAPGVRSA